MRKIVVEVPDEKCNGCKLLKYIAHGSKVICLYMHKAEPTEILHRIKPTSDCRDAAVKA